VLTGALGSPAMLQPKPLLSLSYLEDDDAFHDRFKEQELFCIPLGLPLPYPATLS
jgi:hypothetical protein